MIGYNFRLVQWCEPRGFSQVSLRCWRFRRLFDGLQDRGRTRAAVAGRNSPVFAEASLGPHKAG